MSFSLSLFSFAAAILFWRFEAEEAAARDGSSHPEKAGKHGHAVSITKTVEFGDAFWAYAFMNIFSGNLAHKTAANNAHTR